MSNCSSFVHNLFPYHGCAQSMGSEKECDTAVATSHAEELAHWAHCLSPLYRTSCCVGWQKNHLLVLLMGHKLQHSWSNLAVAWWPNYSIMSPPTYFWLPVMTCCCQLHLFPTIVSVFGGVSCSGGYPAPAPDAHCPSNANEFWDQQQKGRRWVDGWLWIVGLSLPVCCLRWPTQSTSWMYRP